MKKKLVGVSGIVVLLFCFVFANTGFAAAVKKKIDVVFGSYAVQLKGKSQTTENIAYGSKVYIPITELTKLTGATVSKNKNVYNITPVTKEDGITRKNIDDIKLLVKFMDYYNTLMRQDISINLLADSLDSSYYDIRDNHSNERLNNTITKYNQELSIYNGLINQFLNLKKSSSEKGYNTANDETVASGILNEYNQSLNCIYNAIDNLKEYYRTGSQINVNSYRQNVITSLNNSMDAQGKASTKYLNYLSLINSK